VAAGASLPPMVHVFSGARKLDLLRTAPKPLLLTASGGP
jgi:hypothetical protein